MCTDIHDFWYATLPVNVAHTVSYCKFTTLSTYAYITYPVTRATGNSRFENAKFHPAKEKIPENSRSVKCLILHALAQ